jgi:pyruvate dehydrogenase (quinone)
VCAGSSGPGCIHLINGLYDAHRSGAPVLAIAAHIPSSEIGTGYFQESHPDRLFVDCSHYSEVLTSARQMPRMLQIAMQNAVSRRGVSVIVVPGDVAQEQVEATHLTHDACAVARATSRPCDPTMQSMAEILNESGKVTILAGAGCAGAHEQLIEVAGKLKSPVVHALRGKEHVAYDNPYDVGMTGLIGLPAGYRAMEQCDALLLLGTDLPYADWYPKDKKVIQIDIDAGRLGRRCALTLGAQGDMEATLRALLPLLDAKTDTNHLDEARARFVSAQDKFAKHIDASRDKAPIHPEVLTAELSRRGDEDAIFTADVGMNTVWAARFLAMSKGRRLLGSFTHGSMANALPQAIGAQLTYPGRQVISLSGDGGLAMLMGELLTVVQLELPIKVVVYNNSSLNMVKLEQNVAGLSDFGTSLVNPNFARVAESMDMRGIRLEDPGELEDAVASTLEHRGPVLLDVVTTPNELSMPPKTTLSQVQGYSLYLLKEVLGGRGKTVIDTLKELS